MDASDNQSASQQIDAIVQHYNDWRGEKLALLRKLITEVSPAIVEEVKWKKPSKPEGVPVWSANGILCIGEGLKNAVRLTFPKGALIHDPERLFNTRLDSKSVRAIDIYEADSINEQALQQLIQAAIKLNTSTK